MINPVFASVKTIFDLMESQYPKYEIDIFDSRVKAEKDLEYKFQTSKDWLSENDYPINSDYKNGIGYRLYIESQDYEETFSIVEIDTSRLYGDCEPYDYKLLITKDTFVGDGFLYNLDLKLYESTSDCLCDMHEAISRFNSVHCDDEFIYDKAEKYKFQIAFGNDFIDLECRLGISIK